MEILFKETATKFQLPSFYYNWSAVNTALWWCKIKVKVCSLDTNPTKEKHLRWPSLTTFFFLSLLNQGYLFIQIAVLKYAINETSLHGELQLHMKLYNSRKTLKAYFLQEGMYENKRRTSLSVNKKIPQEGSQCSSQSVCI
jgi:hypothetical protein